MNAESTTVKPRSTLRLILLWMLGLMGVSALTLALIAVDLLTLNRETAALRKAMFAATGVSGKTVVQLDIGPAWMAASRAIVACVPQVPAEARLALQSARRACVGVYQIPRGTQVRDGAALMARADELMTARGWTRTVGVCDKAQTVLLYLPSREKPVTDCTCAWQCVRAARSWSCRLKSRQSHCRNSLRRRADSRARNWRCAERAGVDGIRLAEAELCP